MSTHIGSVELDGSSNMLLSVIIVSYNTKALTLQAVTSVFTSIENSQILKEQTEVWVVDNHSDDGSSDALSALEKKYNHYHFIQNETNTGFAAANNLAMNNSNGKYLLLLNSDTIVLDNALEKMVECFEKSPIDQTTAVLERTFDKLDHLGVLSAQLINLDGTTQSQGGSFPSLISLAIHMTFLDDIPILGKLLPSTQHTGRNVKNGHDSIYQVDWVGGTAMMIRKEVITEVGLLDDSIFMYGEDVEFCMRAKNHHWDVAVLPVAQITHFGSASSSSKNAIIGELKGYLYIWSKHMPIWQRPLVKWLVQLGILLRVILFGTMIRDAHRAAIYKEANLVVRSL